VGTRPKGEAHHGAPCERDSSGRAAAVRKRTIGVLARSGGAGAYSPTVAEVAKRQGHRLAQILLCLAVIYHFNCLMSFSTRAYSRIFMAFFICFCLPLTTQAQPPVVIEPVIPILDNGGNKGGTNPTGTTPTTDPNFERSLEERAKEAENKKKEINDKKKDQNEERDQEDKRKDILVRKRQGELPEAKIWGQQFFRDQSISLFTRSRDIKAFDNYLLDIGDEIIVNVWGQAEYSCNTVIDNEGYIDLSGAGISMPRLYIKGMQFGAAKQSVIARLSNHMRVDKSQYAVTLNYSRDITVNITGEVFNPGSYTIPAINTAFNALVASEGPSQIGSVRKIQVASVGKPIRTLDVYKFITNPTAVDEFFLRNNDYIFVPLAERVVKISGAVKRPFFYELIEGENLVKLLYYAGGLQPDAYRMNVQIKRYVNDEERLIDVNLKEILKNNADFELINGDIIEIAPIKQAYANYVKIVGAVKLPGEYELDGQTRVRDVMVKSGIIYSAVMDKVYIKRLRQDLSLEYIAISAFKILDNPADSSNILLRPLDEIEVKYKSEFIDKYNIGVFGAVRKQGNYEYSPNLTLADVIYVSNGIRSEAASSYIEISRLARDKDSSYIIVQMFEIGKDLSVKGADKFTLEPYDQIFVRQAKAFELPMNVTIEGEVRYPGVYTITNRNETVSDLIARAGGTTEVAFLEGATLQRPQDGFVLLDLRDIVLKKNSKSPFNYLLKRGDAIVVPKVKDLVSIAGRVRHPFIRDNSEIAEIQLELDLKRATTDLEREEIIAKNKINIKKDPLRVNVPFHKSKNAHYYVKKYGAGIDRVNGGRRRLIFVRYSNGLVRKTRNFGLFKIYPKVERGAMVFVEPKIKKPKEYRERKEFNWNAAVQNGIAQLTAAATLALIAIRLL
jgi:protein involved in polysaccharide export with SLBB domain